MFSISLTRRPTAISLDHKEIAVVDPRPEGDETAHASGDLSSDPPAGWRRRCRLRFASERSDAKNPVFYRLKNLKLGGTDEVERHA
jgi:hypothetical protein